MVTQNAADRRMIIKLGVTVDFIHQQHALRGVVVARLPAAGLAEDHQYDCRLLGTETILPAIACTPVRPDPLNFEPVRTGLVLRATPMDSPLGGTVVTRSRAHVGGADAPIEERAGAVVEAILIARGIEHDREIVEPLTRLLVVGWGGQTDGQHLGNQSYRILMGAMGGDTSIDNLLRTSACLVHAANLSR